MIEHYRVVRLLGHGGMGEVWLARDTTLGRRVALKVIKPSRLTAEGAEAQFLEEARMTARFAHPHIVTVYGAGSTLGTVWVALEYLEGTTLRDRLNAKRPGHRAVLRFGLAIADALCAAHEAGILHRDLKPENVMIPPDGRLRVLDFGLATARGSDDRRILGTPQYMAPERWEPGEPDEGADIWSLGLILYELVSGMHPYMGATTRAIALAICSDESVPEPPNAAELPPDVISLIQACLARAPQDRPSAQTVATRLRGLLDGAAISRDRDLCPFPGLMPFTEHQADMFFGRSDDVSALVERLRLRPVLPVVGPSGAGKSSLILAGLVPRLREAESWSVISVRPGLRPFAALASQLLGRHRSVGELMFPTMDEADPVGTGPVAGIGASLQADSSFLAERLADQPHALSVILHSIAEAQSSRVLLFVDQLEELYTHTHDPDRRRRFLAALFRAADDPSSPVRVVFTLRDDFLGRVAEGADAAAALSHIAVVRTPGREALKETLTGPLRAVDWRFEDDALCDRMVDEVVDEPSALPLLQFAARRLWEHRRPADRTLTVDGYQKIGGVVGALAEHADGVLDGLPPAHLRLARDLLLRMVHADGTRRVAARGDVLVGLPDPASAVLDRLIDARLLITHKPDAHATRDDAELEIVHESLTTHWATLARWIDESRDELALLAEVRQAAELWDKRGRRETEVWAGDILTDARRMTERVAVVPDVVSAFLEAGHRRALEAYRRRRRITGAAALGLLLLALTGFVVALAFNAQREDAVISRDQAQAERQVARAERRVADEQRAAVMRQAATNAWTRGDFVMSRALFRGALEFADHIQLRALWRQIGQSPWRWRTGDERGTRAIAPSPDGMTLAVATWEGQLYLKDVETEQATPLPGTTGRVVDVRYTPGGDGLVGLDRFGRWWWRRLPGGELDRSVVLPAGAERYALSRNGAWAVVASVDAFAVYDAEGRVTHRCPRRPGALALLAIGDDGDALLTTRHGGASELISVGTCTVRHRDTVIFSALLGPWFLTAEDPGIRLVDVATLAVGLEVTLPGRPLAVALSPDGLQLSLVNDAAIVTWDIRSGRELSRVRHQAPGNAGCEYLPDGLLAAGGYGQKLVLLHPARSSPPAPSGHTGVIWRVAASARQGVIASASHDGTARIWDIKTATELHVLRGHEGPVSSIAISPVAPLVATGDYRGQVRLWSATTGHAEGRTVGHRHGVLTAAFSPDGALLATGARRVRLWRVADRSPVWSGPPLDVALDSLAFSRDGQRIAYGSTDGRVRAMETEGGQQLFDMGGHSAVIRGLVFTPDSGRVVTGSLDGTLREWDATTGAALATHVQPSKVLDVTSGTGPRSVITANSDGFVWSVELDSGKRTPLTQHDADVNAVALSADGSLVASGSDDRTVRVWSIADGAPRWRTPVANARPTQQLPTAEGVSAAAITSAGRATGYEDGRLELSSASGSVVALDTSAAPAIPVTAVIGAPGNTLLAGFSNGFFGLWSLESGALLESGQLHGPIASLRLDGNTAHIASKLGQSETRDYSALTEPWCDLLKKVWAETPVAVEDGRVVRRASPAAHPCVAK